MKKGCFKIVGALALVCIVGIGIILYLVSQDAKHEPIYTVLESKQLERYGKSQVTLCVALTDTTTTHEDIKDLLHSLVKTASDLKMDKRDKPTNVYVYIYKTKASYEADTMNWVMMYGKNNSQEEGTFTYQPLVSH